MKSESSLDLELRNFFDEVILGKIRRARIGIAGAGGLGSNCAAFLARSGFRELVIADFDIVSPSNLNRQFFFEDQIGMLKTDALYANLRRINPAVNPQLHPQRINERNVMDIFGECDVLVEAVDTPECKAMIAESAVRAGIFTVCASGIAGVGHCDDIGVHRVNETLCVVGDLKSAVSETSPPCAPRVAAASAMQADIVLEYIITRQEPVKRRDDTCAL
jgi:sulfur carrier protein ThiS adenylyltransferase